MQRRIGGGGVQDGRQHPGSEPRRLPAHLRGAAAAPAGMVRARDQPAAAAAGQPLQPGRHRRRPRPHHRPAGAAAAQRQEWQRLRGIQDARLTVNLTGGFVKASFLSVFYEI